MDLANHKSDSDKRKRKIIERPHFFAVERTPATQDTYVSTEETHRRIQALWQLQVSKADAEAKK